MEKIQAAIHSLDGKFDEATLLRHLDQYNCIIEYKGELYKSLYNPFNGYYYVDDKYGHIPQI